MPQQLFSTADIGLAAFLRLQNYPLIKIDRESSGRAFFVFEDNSQREALTFRFFNKQGTVEPVGYLDQIRSLKALINQNSSFKKSVKGGKEP